MNVDAQIVADWATTHALGLNVKKTSAIIFGSAQNLRYLSSILLPPLLINNQQINLVDKVKA